MSKKEKKIKQESEKENVSEERHGGERGRGSGWGPHWEGDFGETPESKVARVLTIKTSPKGASSPS